jgi:hypothetical protein
MSTFSLSSYKPSDEKINSDFSRNIQAIVHCPICIIPTTQCNICLAKKGIFEHMKNCIFEDCKIKGCKEMSEALVHLTSCKGCNRCHK